MGSGSALGVILARSHDRNDSPARDGRTTVKPLLSSLNSPVGDVSDDDARAVLPPPPPPPPLPSVIVAIVSAIRLDDSHAASTDVLPHLLCVFASSHDSRLRLPKCVVCVCVCDGESESVCGMNVSCAFVRATVSVSGMNEGVHEGRCGDERKCGRDENLRT